MMDVYLERKEFGPGLCDLQEEWDGLLLRSSRPTVYSSFDYVYTSCRHFKKDEEIFFLLFRDKPGGRLLAIFPLGIWAERRRGIAVRTVRHGVWTKTSDVDKPYPIIDRDHEEACWTGFSNYFRKGFREWEIIQYDELAVDSHLNRELPELFPFPAFWTKKGIGPDSPIVRLDGRWAEFWAAHPNMRRINRRLEKRLGDRLAYAVTNDPSDVERCLDEYAATEQMGWKAGTGITREHGLPFYQELLPKMAANGRVYFGMLYDGDTVVSAEISYVFADRVYFALGTYNPAYATLSPGTVSTSRFIRFFHDKGYVEGDFLAGFAHYINAWAYRTEKTANIAIRRIGWVNMYLAATHFGQRLASKIKHALGRRNRDNDREKEGSCC